MKYIFNLFIAVGLLFFTGCATVKYNGISKFVKKVDYPEINKVTKAYIGDYLVKKGSLIEEQVLVVNKPMGGVSYKIPSKTYYGLGKDEKFIYFEPTGVTRGAIFDPFNALAYKLGETKELCVVTVFSATVCYKGDFSLENKLSQKGDSFQQTLIYSGRVGDRINISYREFSNNLARPAFNNDVEYDLKSSKVIGYKGALLEVIEADNMSITYKLIRNFN